MVEGGLRQHGSSTQTAGEAVDADQLGCSLYELPAGTRAWPYHYHTANEEALFVLAGTGTLRADGEMHELRAGDYVTFPADESGPHRAINDSERTLRYLVVSTMTEPDVTVYPDSEKFGVYVGSPPGGREERSLEGYLSARKISCRLRCCQPGMFDFQNIRTRIILWTPVNP